MNKFIIICILSMFLIISNVSADNFIANVTASNAELTFLTTTYLFAPSQYSFNMEVVDDVYYVSYSDNDATSFLQNFIASSDDFGATWTTTQLTSNPSNKDTCQLYIDVDFDLICIRRVPTSNSQLEYFIIPYGDSNWESSSTIWEETISYFAYTSLIMKRGDYIWLHPTGYDPNNIENFMVDFEHTSYDNLIESTTESGNDYEDVAWVWVEIWARIQEQSRVGGDKTFGDIHSFFNGAGQIDYVYDNGTSPYNVTHYGDITGATITRNEFLWLYYDESYNIYVFFVDETSDTLKYIKKDADSANFGAVVNLNINSSIYQNNIDLIEGSDYIWGVYTTSPDYDLRRIQINKTGTLTLIEDVMINDNSNITLVGNLYGEKKLNDASSNRLISNDLRFVYVEGDIGTSKKMFFYTEEVNDIYSTPDTEPDLSCNYDFDCTAKFDDSYSCVAGLCVSSGVAEDPEFQEGDLAFSIDVWLDALGVSSNASKIFMGIVIILILTITASAIAGSVSQNTAITGIIGGITAFLATIMVVYLGLIPFWVVIMIIVLGGAIVGLMFKGRG